MFSRAVVVVVAALSAPVFAQLTLTGCHLDNGREVCFLPGGAETTISTSSSVALPTNSPTPTPTAPSSVPASTTAAAQTTAVTACHMHETTQMCINGAGAEVEIKATPTGISPLPESYNDCHAHGSETFCMAPDGQEVEIVADASTEAGHGDAGAEESGGENCHFHAGVEHCTGDGAHEGEANCERRDRDYRVNLRIGLIFVMLATSLIAVYAPMFMKEFLKVNTSGTIFTVIKQFGTGVIIATALVHLLTHAEMMFGNACLGELKYEATATAIAMASAFIAFAIDLLARKLAEWRQNKTAGADNENSPSSSVNEKANPTEDNTAVAPPATSGHNHGPGLSPHTSDAVSVLVLEAGIIFHSLLIGITVVVAGDSVFGVLFVVIVFHQMFEGLALGARIASLSASGMSKIKYYILPLAFAFITPIGMAIGVGVLKKFNGNSPGTIVAIGTLDSISAGILLWVGFVDMWAGDWLYGELRDAGLRKTVWGLLGLVGGMALMGLLGKWA
ncbi:hypothetical protein HYFRA_00008452 [Hymenoscyphus fraxineus]|uniref:Uncharacterized protein n=1 Tax=Hymenoscyphus fraxineus TaxID=746836 RepID=A0A9N9KMV0_9HELO|nr:hypothetical protein HYFRA_00008452 [Hymenoscyphus fraxineus]